MKKIRAQGMPPQLQRMFAEAKLATKKRAPETPKGANAAFVAIAG